MGQLWPMKHALLFPAWSLMAMTLSNSASAQSSFWTATETTLRGSRLSDLADTAYLLPWDLEALKMRETRTARQWWTDPEGRELTSSQGLLSPREDWMGSPPAPSEQLGSPPMRSSIPPEGIQLDEAMELGSGWTLTWRSATPQQVYAKGDSSIAFSWRPSGNRWSVWAEERIFSRSTLNGLCMQDWSLTERSSLVGYGPSGAESQPSLSLQPNPRGLQELQVSLAGSAGIWPSAIRCVDSFGRLTAEQPPQGTLPLKWNPNGLNSGRYSIQIQLGNQTYASSFIQF